MLVEQDFSYEKLEINKFCSRKINNERYFNLSFNHFIAGDEEQIIDKIDKYKIDKITMDSLRFIFIKYKRGIFIQIRNKIIKTFLPFNNIKFDNRISNLLKCVPMLKSYNTNLNEWNVDDYLICPRNELRIYDNDIGLLNNIFEELIKNRELQDCDFIINYKTFPLITNDGSEAYSNIYEGDEFTQLNKYIPILSYSSKSNFSDKLFITSDDWTRVQSIENGMIFPPRYQSYNNQFNKDFNSKINKAIFRGNSDGNGTTSRTNIRLKLYEMRNNINLDVGITNISSKLLVYKDNQKIHKHDTNIEITLPITYEEKSQYKYIINIEGNVASFDLSIELGMYSIILLVESDWKLWYSHLLIPYTHYIPIKKDLSDLISQIEWCNVNQDKCNEIINNTNNFYKNILSKNGMFNYMENLINDIARKTEFRYLTMTEQRYETMDIRNSDSVLNFNTILDYNSITRFNSIFISEILPYNTLEYFRIINLLDQNIRFGCENVESNHEIIIGYHMNELRNEIPYFQFIINNVKEDFGITLKYFLLSKEFTFEGFFHILSHVNVALKLAQDRFGFTHYNLSPVNVRLFKINNMFIPMISEYKFSRLKRMDGVIQFYLNSNFDKNIDMWSLFTKSLILILNQSLDNNPMVFQIVERISGAPENKFNNINSVKNYLFRHTFDKHKLNWDFPKLNKLIMPKNMN